MSVEPVPNAFLGSSDFAVAVLRILAASAHRPALVVAPPDRPRGRGRKRGAPPVAEAAAELGLDLHQTASVNEPESTAAITASGARLGCVCAFGQLIKEPLLSELPMLNVHPSLLPRWRGAAPIERAMLAGDEETGVAVIRLTEGLDSGPIAIVERTAIDPAEDFGSLSARLAALGGELLVSALDREAAGTLRFEPQPEEGITYAEKIDAADRRLDPTRSAAELARTVRALTPHIGAYLELEGSERLGVRRAAAGAGGLEPGSVEVAGDILRVGCGEGVLEIGELKPAGGRAMSSADYLRGHEPPARVL